jgi:hypothetical protein
LLRPCSVWVSGRRLPPPIFFAYVLGLGVLVLLGLLPSKVETTYNWQGSLLLASLVFGLAWGSNLCRWILSIVGVIWALTVMSLQALPLEVVATTWSVTALIVTGLLLTASMREHTRTSR